MFINAVRIPIRYLFRFPLYMRLDNLSKFENLSYAVFLWSQRFFQKISKLIKRSNNSTSYMNTTVLFLLVNLFFVVVKKIIYKAPEHGDWIPLRCEEVCKKKQTKKTVGQICRETHLSNLNNLLVMQSDIISTFMQTQKYSVQLLSILITDLLDLEPFLMYPSCRVYYTPTKISTSNLVTEVTSLSL